MSARDSSIGLVIDGAEVLVGETLPTDACRAAWSRSAGLVRVAEEQVRQSPSRVIIERLGEPAPARLREALPARLQEVPHNPEYEER